MAKTWDLSSILRGKAAVALFATTATLAGGAHALAPAVASAERTNCTMEPQGCDGDSGGGGDSSATGIDPANDGFDDPFSPDPAIQRELNGTQPILRSLDPARISWLTNSYRIDPEIVDSASNPGDLSVLTGDCYRLSSMIGTLEAKANLLDRAASRLPSGVGAGPFLKHMKAISERKEDRAYEFHALECNTVLSLDGRD